MWEQPTEQFLQLPGLLPFAVLSQTKNAENVLGQVAVKVESIEDKLDQSNIATATAILAGLVLKKDVIKSVLRQEIMRESVIYQEIEAGGIEQGVQREAVSFALRLLKRRLGGVKPDLQA